MRATAPHLSYDNHSVTFYAVHYIPYSSVDGSQTCSAVEVMIGTGGREDTARVVRSAVWEARPGGGEIGIRQEAVL